MYGSKATGRRRFLRGRSIDAGRGVGGGDAKTVLDWCSVSAETSVEAAKGSSGLRSKFVFWGVPLQTDKRFTWTTCIHCLVVWTKFTTTSDRNDSILQGPVHCRPTIWNLKKIQMAKQKFRLISGLAELTSETKITAKMRLVANILGWNTAEPHF